MTAWSKPAHHFQSHADSKIANGYRFGIDLSLEQLIETRNKPVIQWLAPESQVKTSRVGGFRSRFKGRGMDFDEVRLYQIGDDIRNIDWRVTARTGEAHTKLFKEEREKPVFVVLDQMPSMFFGTATVFKAVVASQIAAQLMWNTLNNGDRFGALLFSDAHHLEMKPSSNRRNCMRLLNRIVETHQQCLQNAFTNEQSAVASTQSQANDSANPLAQTLRRLKHLAKPGTLIHLVSDFNLFDDDCRRHLSKISQHTDIHCVLINDPIEKQLPPAGAYSITDGKNVSILDTYNKQIRQHYEQSFNQKVEQVMSFALSHKGAFSQVDTAFQQRSLSQSLSSLTKESKMNQQANPLDQLRDIHLPEPVTAFELAPGWWFIILVLLITLSVYCFNYYKKKKRLAILKPIAKEFSQLEQLSADVQAMAKLNEMLKRVVLIYYPATRVANLTGETWINFLNTQSSEHQISSDEALWLTQGAYQKAISITQADWTVLANKCHQILVQMVIRQTLSKPARIKS